MRVRLGWLGVATLAAIAVLAPAAPAQDLGPDVRYWPLKEISFPVPIEKIQAMKPRPSKLRFYAAPERGKFRLATEKAIDELDVINADKNQRGFRYTTAGDGEYDFALQFVYAEGDTQPREDALTAQYRIVVDTRPPLIRVGGSGTNGIEWAVEDENPNPDGVTVEVRWQGSNKWTAISPRVFRTKDQYTWAGLTVSQPLEVRVIAKDRAGQETVSRVLTLPNSGGGSAAPFPSPSGGTSPRGFDDIPNRPQIDYVNTRNLNVESKLTRVTRSGVKAAHLWVNDNKSGWTRAKEQTVSIASGSADPTIRIPYTALKDGLYGFIVIPVNGADGKQDDPRPNDQAQLLVQVDTEIPFVEVKNVRVSAGSVGIPRVEIEWDAKDSNLMPDPIDLEYASTEKGPDWKPIALKVPNTGRYTWEVEDKNLWRFYVRARAKDKANNTGEFVFKREIIVDLEKPQAVIEKVAGGTKDSVSERPPVVLPSPGPSVVPQPAPPVVTPSPPASSPILVPNVAPVDTPSAPGGVLPVPNLP